MRDTCIHCGHHAASRNSLFHHIKHCSKVKDGVIKGMPLDLSHLVNERDEESEPESYEIAEAELLDDKDFENGPLSSYTHLRVSLISANFVGSCTTGPVIERGTDKLSHRLNNPSEAGLSLNA